jgi:hypothetical protein
MEAIGTAMSSMFLAAWILTAVYFSIATVHLAMSKGYGREWFFYGLFFGFFAFLHAGFMPLKPIETNESIPAQPSTEDNELTKRLVDALERKR